MSKKSKKQKKRRLKAYFLRILFVSAVLVAMLLIVFGISRIMEGGSLVSAEEATEDTIYIKSKGSMTGAVVEAFDKDYYSEEELKKMIDDEVAAYKKVSGTEKGVTLSEFRIENKLAKVLLKYASDVDYRNFNGKELYAGTIAGMYDAGVTFDSEIKSVQDGTLINKTELLALKKYHGVALEEPITVVVPGKIAYTSANVELINSKTAKISEDSTELAYIIYK